MEYYTMRHGMRQPISKSHDITIDKYALLLHCCEKYYDNIAWKYPEACPDGAKCCGLNHQNLVLDIKYEIPSLYRDEYNTIAVPCEHKNIFDAGSKIDSYDQYALLDYIEFIGANVRDISRKVWHGFFGHHDLTFDSTTQVFTTYRDEINAVFRKTGLLYELTTKGIVERLEEYGVLEKNTEVDVSLVAEDGLRELLTTAISLHKSPHPEDHKNSVEKIWDALERLKTYYTHLDKKSSAAKIINDIADGRTEFVTLFDAEFRALTDIGNNFRIRHHETNRVDIKDLRHFDYFFNRCLSLIALSLQYLQ